MKKDDRDLNYLIFTDEYCGIQFWIMQRGFHGLDHDLIWYCAYVKPPEDKLDLDVNELEVHGGITYRGGLRPHIEDYVWGWDYHHSFDIVDFPDHLATRLQIKPIKEVIDIVSEDCQDFIRQYLL